MKRALSILLMVVTAAIVLNAQMSQSASVGGEVGPLKNEPNKNFFKCPSATFKGTYTISWGRISLNPGIGLTYSQSYHEFIYGGSTSRYEDHKYDKMLYLNLGVSAAYNITTVVGVFTGPQGYIQLWSNSHETPNIYRRYCNWQFGLHVNIKHVQIRGGYQACLKKKSERDISPRIFVGASYRFWTK